MSRSPVREGQEQSALDRYFAGWVDLNAAMRRGESWSGGERNAAFLSSAPGGKLQMVDAAPLLGLDDPGDGRSAARIDLDFDGDDDLVVTNRTAPRVRIYANRLADGGTTLGVRLVGTRSNREAIGAVVYATPLTGGAEPPTETIRTGSTQRRSRTVGSGYLAQSSAWLRFAFAKDPGARRAPRVHLRVRWPGANGGVLEDFGVVRANRRYLLEEGSGAAREATTPPALALDAASITPPDLGTEDGRRRLVLPAPASIPSLGVRARNGRVARLFGITPGGPRGAGRPTILVAWDSTDPKAIEALGDVAALCAESREANALLVAIDLAATEVPEGEPDPLLLGATRLAAAGWTGDILAAAPDAALVLPEIVGWRLDRTTPPPGPWSMVIEPDGRLAILRTGPWRKGDVAGDMELLAVPTPGRPSVSTPYPGVWADPPGDADLGRLRGRLVRLGADEAVRELDLARVKTTRLDSAEVQIRLGQAQLQRGDLAGALQRFEAAIESDGENALARRARAYTLHLLERYDEAKDEWTAALRLDPSDLDTRGNRALAAVAAGDLDLARGDLDVLKSRAGPTAPVVLAVKNAIDLAEREGGGGR